MVDPGEGAHVGVLYAYYSTVNNIVTWELLVIQLICKGEPRLEACVCGGSAHTRADLAWSAEKPCGVWQEPSWKKGAPLRNPWPQRPNIWFVYNA